ncbi:unnamed protein product [Phyllotreta striolata]|uniref:Uncharacterized protein n=1 Tax=Phyllotreta striolata TaxID=444603 RepID=A0A9N9TLI5_PHYSR|nr:unnamed protein product [Phyllotreta striolata]
MELKAIYLCLFLLYVRKVSSLKCYTCSCTEDDSDTTCLTGPGKKSGMVTDCDKKYCYTVRVDYKDPRGKLQSLLRTCLDKPDYMHEVIEDETHRSYYMACKSDLCNNGNGRTDGSDQENGAFGDKSTIYCPGIGSNRSSVINVNMFMYVVIYLAYCCL